MSLVLQVLHCSASVCILQVAESGLDFVIVRTAKTDGEAPPSDSGVSVTPQGSLTSNSTATKSQVSLTPLPIYNPPPSPGPCLPPTHPPTHPHTDAPTDI